MKTRGHGDNVGIPTALMAMGLEPREQNILLVVHRGRGNGRRRSEVCGKRVMMITWARASNILR